ncbi:glycoprotein-N-acetylgalactosamine 3-beta-galactosyltransferase 1-like [Ylistrum balloti]|uniref:glycoprotein-N-acetylgalactosamine 3-beta-galactosyltransferase 1-like n=1 Tax=Ylistrum balloti TaxID=509963 RepID=UPI002905DD6B|nr:glycoprotein-N-acetylgalactosamine 3-beta-galactosyltransferase 1-like [Ylistrum balloti]
MRYFISGCTSQLFGLNLGFGVVTGMLIGFVVFSLSSIYHPTINSFVFTIGSVEFTHNNRSLHFRSHTPQVTKETGRTRKFGQKDNYRNDTIPTRSTTRNMVLADDSKFHHDDDKVAKELRRNVRVLCMVMTNTKHLNTKATYVKQTWAKRCNKVLFISSETNLTFPAVGFNIPEGREHLTAKTMKAFKYIFENHFTDADWFIKIEDNSFVILENLRYFLSSYSPNDAVYFGHSFKSIVKQGFYCGGGGHVLSKEALRRLAISGSSYQSCQYGEDVDVELGKCMEILGIETTDTNDVLGRSRFHCFDLEKQLSGVFPKWYYKYDANGAKQGTDSISDYTISFQVAPPLKVNMYKLEFYIYHLRPYGIDKSHQSLNILHSHL